MKPLIGIPTAPFRHSFSEITAAALTNEEQEYFWLLSRLTEKISHCVRLAGGIPLILTPTEDTEETAELVKKLDGFLFAGGSDLSPDFYGAENEGSIAPWRGRDSFELALCREALALDKPLFGICRGCQLLNVALGGTLIQHLPTVKAEWALHRRSDVMKGYVHKVKILEPSLFQKTAEEEIEVNSMHHQAVDRLGIGLQKAAETEDGLTEAIWAPEHRCAFAVQWHPECLAEEDSLQAALFSSFVAKAAKSKTAA